MPHPETQIPMARPHPTPPKHDSPNANPNGTAQQSADLTKRCACAAKCITFLARHVGVMQITMELRCKLTRDTSMKSHLQKLPPMAANLRRDDDDTTTTSDDRRRETTTRRKPCKHSSNPQTPNYKREPFATHSGKKSTFHHVQSSEGLGSENPWKMT